MTQIWFASCRCACWKPWYCFCDYIWVLIQDYLFFRVDIIWHFYLIINLLALSVETIYDIFVLLKKPPFVLIRHFLPLYCWFQGAFHLCHKCFFLIMQLLFFIAECLWSVNLGFRYSDVCPVDYADKMETCKEEYLDKTLLTFHDENDLVAAGRKRDVREACR